MDAELLAPNANAEGSFKVIQTLDLLLALSLFSPSRRFLEPTVRIPVHRSKAHPGFNPRPCPLVDLGTLSCLWVYYLAKILLKIMLFLSFFFFNLYFERETECEQGRSRGEGDTESEAGSRPRAVSTEPDVGLKPTNCEILT